MLVKLLTIKNSVFISIVVIPETTYPERKKQMCKTAAAFAWYGKTRGAIGKLKLGKPFYKY
jgi:hypothetical protein